MTEHIYKLIEVTGTSKESHDAAVANAVKKASETVRNMRWFEVVETRGDIEEDKVSHWQVTLKIGFRLE